MKTVFFVFSLYVSMVLSCYFIGLCCYLDYKLNNFCLQSLPYFFDGESSARIITSIGTAISKLIINIGIFQAMLAYFVFVFYREIFINYTCSPSKKFKKAKVNAIFSTKIIILILILAMIGFGFYLRAFLDIAESTFQLLDPLFRFEFATPDDKEDFQSSVATWTGYCVWLGLSCGILRTIERIVISNLPYSKRNTNLVNYLFTQTLKKR